jgi:hypothetical protein
VRLPVEKLLLDRSNPRLPGTGKARSQDELVALLAEDFSLAEIGQSLADNGYFAEEPLAAVPYPESTKRDAQQFVVIEGNRRLASLKLLTDAALRRRIGLKEWDALASRAPSDLSTVPVIVYGRRADLLSFMGFRHITGVKPWEPLAKARFIHSLIEDHGLDFEDAARRVGSKANAIRQQFVAYRVYVQAKDQFGVDVSGIERAYGVFFRAMSSAPLKEHIGIGPSKEAAKDPGQLVSPVPAKRAEQLGEFVSWIVGTNDKPPVISESRQITALGEVVESREALALLRVSGSLEIARQLTGGEEARLLGHLGKASFHLDEALKDAHRHAKSARAQALLERCESTLAQLRRSMTA